MKSIAIIPARGGSKRIPRKNIRNFLGKPIVSYSIETCIKSELFNEVMVSTEDEEIASIARTYGAKVPFLRSQKNADDYASTVDVIIEVIEWYRNNGQKFDIGCCIYPTAPLVRVDRIKEGWQLMCNQKYKTVFPITRFSSPIWRSLQVTDGKVNMIWPQNLTKRSQDLPAAFYDAGQWYWFDIEQLCLSKQLWTDNTFGLEINELESQDIDNESDWKLAELKYRYITGA
jgi:pseudaminic acid cytidylyltransferase